MTKEERIIVSAYTGFLMCDFNDLRKYIQEKLGRPVWSHELANERVLEEIRKKIRPEFIALCRED